MSEENKSLLERLKSNKTYVKLKEIKNIEIIIAIVVCLVAIGVYLVIDFSKKDVKSTGKSSSQSELEAVLGQIKGVGKINVLITYGTGGESVIGQEDSSMTLEPSTGNGSFWGSSGSLGSSNKNAKIIGIIIVCEGASDPEVQAKLLSATQVATGVSIDRIRIYPMK